MQHEFQIVNKTTGKVLRTLSGSGLSRVDARKRLMYYFYKMYDPSCVRLEK